MMRQQPGFLSASLLPPSKKKKLDRNVRLGYMIEHCVQHYQADVATWLQHFIQNYMQHLMSSYQTLMQSHLHHAIHNGVDCQARKKAVAVLVLILLESEEKGPIKRRNNHVRVRGSIKGRKWVLVLLPFETG